MQDLQRRDPDSIPGWEYQFFPDMKKQKFDRFLHGSFLINRKINATIVFYYKSTPLFSTISHFELLSENNGPPIGYLLSK